MLIGYFCAMIKVPSSDEMKKIEMQKMLQISQLRFQISNQILNTILSRPDCDVDKVEANIDTSLIYANIFMEKLGMIIKGDVN